MTIMHHRMSIEVQSENVDMEDTRQREDKRRMKQRRVLQVNGMAPASTMSSGAPTNAATEKARTEAEARERCILEEWNGLCLRYIV